MLVKDASGCNVKLVSKLASLSQRFEMASDKWQGRCNGGDITEQG